MIETGKEDSRIMIVDDTPQNLRLLENMLSKRGYQVYALPNGEMALKAAKKSPPDLILLDINMPGMDGYEVCRRMKETPQLSRIPVIFLSALTEITDKMDAFKVGGVDYITKPFQFEEVNARVVTHLKIHYLQKALEESNKNLEQKIAERTHQLAEANERLKSLDRIKSDFLSMICHEMRTPVNGLFGLASVAFEMCKGSKEGEELRTNYEQSRRRMEELLDDSLLLGSLEDAKLDSGVNNVLLFDFVKNIAENSGIQSLINCSDEAKEAIVQGGDLLERAISTFIKLAVCFRNSGESISGEIFTVQNMVHLKLDLDNLAISMEDASSFFDITSLARASSFAENMGLSPVVAERIVLLLGGDVHLVNTFQKFGYLEIVLPRCINEPQELQEQQEQQNP